MSPENDESESGGFEIDALGPTLPAYAADLVPEAKRGLGLAAFRSAGDVGFVGAPLALGIVADAFGAPAALAAKYGGKEAPAVASEVIDLSFIEVADVEEIVTKALLAAAQRCCSCPLSR